MGTATARTPILPTPLSGPAILVSHGGAAFPDLDIILQGEDVKIVLRGNTAISGSVTTRPFATVPDAPISSVELVLPQSPSSVLAANGNLCQQHLAMPTALVAQTAPRSTRTPTSSWRAGPKALRVLTKQTTKTAVDLKIYVPSAGKLTASGKGIRTTAKSSTGSETIGLSLHRSSGAKTNVKLAFALTKGQR